MGVTKVLMASNDTLFNFEDTLGDRDRDDILFSPRNHPKTNSSTTSTETSLIVDGQNLLRDDSNSEESDQSTFHQHDDVHILKGNLQPFDFKNSIEEATVQAINELLSPEQPKTFSEDINTIEQLSSDLSGTVEATYTANTLDDLKTCISVHSKDELLEEKDILPSDADDLSCSSASNPANFDVHNSMPLVTELQETKIEDVQLIFVTDDTVVNDETEHASAEINTNNGQKSNEDRMDSLSGNQSRQSTSDKTEPNQRFACDSKENQDPNADKSIKENDNVKMQPNQSGGVVESESISGSEIVRGLVGSPTQFVSIDIVLLNNCRPAN